MVDTIIQAKDRSFREFCSYYTESDPILTYMISRLYISNGDAILEPCAGDGIFIDKILETHSQKNFSVQALDLNPIAIKNLKSKFSDPRVCVRQSDTLLDASLSFLDNFGQYNKIVGNPPYGAWQNFEKRSLLKKIYGGYVKETYTLFLKKCIDLLALNGRLAFIVPDTFLSLHLHKDTREKLLKKTKIEELLLIPSKFFPGVNFGYANLCIITFVRCSEPGNNKIKIIEVNSNVNNLYDLAGFDISTADSCYSLNQQDVLNSPDCSFLLDKNQKARALILSGKKTLGDMADCVTGFYTGDNKKFLSPINTEIKNSAAYCPVDLNHVEENFYTLPNLLNGLTNGKQYIPFLKGGGFSFLKPTEWYVKWDEKTVKYYKSNKKTRFQNSQYYFLDGIGVPMIKSSKFKAFLISGRLFDQSIVGIFPKDKAYLPFLLCFLNSNVCNKLIHTINHTANNSANYLKKIPILFNDSVLELSNKIYLSVLDGLVPAELLDNLDIMLDDLYSI